MWGNEHPSTIVDQLCLGYLGSRRFDTQVERLEESMEGCKDQAWFLLTTSTTADCSLEHEATAITVDI